MECAVHSTLDCRECEVHGTVYCTLWSLNLSMISPVLIRTKHTLPSIMENAADVCAFVCVCDIRIVKKWRVSGGREGEREREHNTKDARTPQHVAKRKGKKIFQKALKEQVLL
jgi:hypothetical protein